MTDGSDDDGAPAERSPPVGPFRFVLRLPPELLGAREPRQTGADVLPAGRADPGDDSHDAPEQGVAPPAPEQVRVARPSAAIRPGRRRRRRAAQRLVLGVNVVAIVGCLVAAGSLWWTYDRVRELPVVSLGTQLVPVGDDLAPTGGSEGDDGAQNFLIVGTDSLAEAGEFDVRADTIMVLRLDPGSERAALLSLPRDLYLPIAGRGGSARINSAIQGGPGALIETIDDALGVPVHHYVEIDFAGFEDLVDAVGGVPVFFPEPVRDQRSFLSVPVAGCTILDPEQALAFVRSRAYEVDRDGGWQVDGSGDLGRISRQQDFIRRVLERAIQRGARNPAALRDLVEIGFDRLTVDDGLALGDVLALGRRFRSFEPGNLDLYSLPVYDEVIQGAQVLRLDRVAAQPTLDLFRLDDGAAGTVVVQVLNGTGEPGVAESAAAALTDVGFVIPAGTTADADRFDYARTTVRFVEGAETEAVRVASHLGADPVFERAPSIAGGRVAVIIGADDPGVVEEPRAVAPGLLPPTTTTTTAPPTSAAPTTDAGDPPPPPPPTTERLGEVPVAPAGATC